MKMEIPFFKHASALMHTQSDGKQTASRQFRGPVSCDPFASGFDLADNLSYTTVRPHGRTRVQLSRETKKQQRRTFRQLFATIGENEPPEEVVSLQNGSLTVADWAHIKQLNALRSCLQSGFQVRRVEAKKPRKTLLLYLWTRQGRGLDKAETGRGYCCCLLGGAQRMEMEGSKYDCIGILAVFCLVEQPVLPLSVERQRREACVFSSNSEHVEVSWREDFASNFPIRYFLDVVGLSRTTHGHGCNAAAVPGVVRFAVNILVVRLPPPPLRPPLLSRNPILHICCICLLPSPKLKTAPQLN